MRLAGFAAISAVTSGVCDAQRLTGPEPTGVVPAPVALDTRGLFQDKFARVGDDVFTRGGEVFRGRDEQCQGESPVALHNCLAGQPSVGWIITAAKC
jgi:hypothetical protein